MISHAEKKPIRILHVFGCMDRGGAETRSVELLRHIDRERFRSDFLSLSGLPGQLDDEIRGLGSAVHLCKLGWGFAKRFAALLEKERFDIVHSHVHFTSGYILRLAEKAGVRGRIAHFRITHDCRAPTPRRLAQRALSRLLVKRHATHVLAVGTGTMVALFGRNWSADPRRRVVHNGVDASRFSVPPDAIGVRREFAMPDDCPLVVHVGNIHKQKNHAFLIAVFSEMKKRIPAARLLLVGRGGGKSECKALAQVERLDLCGSVTFTGSRADVPRLLLAADLVVFPSLWEGLPGAVLEAAAAGVRVIGSDIPGIAELAPHLPQVSCLGLDGGVEAWSRAACDVLFSGHGANERAAMRAHFAAGPFTIEKCAAKTCSVWQQAAQE